MRKRLFVAAAAATLLATGAKAFDVRLSYTPMNELDNAVQTDNVGLEIGHYKNRDKQGFGFGWRLAVTTPTEEGWTDGGTAEVGIAPGYSIIENLDVKLELGVGLHSYNDYDVAFGAYYGAGIDYAAWDHLVLGLALRQWQMNAQVQTVEDENGDDLSYRYSDLRTTAYIGYRF